MMGRERLILCVSVFYFGLLVWVLFFNIQFSLFVIPASFVFFYCHILSVATMCQPLLAFLVFTFYFYSVRGFQKWQNLPKFCAFF